MSGATGAISFRVRDGWGTFATLRRPGHADPLRRQLGRPGLWRHTTDSDGVLRTVFELPPPTLPQRGSDGDGFAALARWVLATADGRVDRVWTAPPEEDVQRWVADSALTLQVGSLLRRGSLVRDEHRLSLGFPIVADIPRDLRVARKRWLRELLADAQDHRPLVRIGLAPQVGARAEVDFSGAPHAVLEQLVPIGLEAVRLAVASLVEAAEFLVHGADGCRALEVRPDRAPRRPHEGVSKPVTREGGQAR